MSTTPLYSQEVINIGANPNDGSGDPLRVAFDKVNNNFTNLFQSFVNTTISYTFGNTQQVIFETPVSTFTQGQFYIKSIANGTPDTQDVQVYAQVNNDSSDVKFTAYGSTFFGNTLTTYDMVVSNEGNVQILVNPLVSSDMTHLVNSQIMWIGISANTANILVDGLNDQILSTETPTGFRL